jgi:hypothetical protein
MTAPGAAPMVPAGSTRGAASSPAPSVPNRPSALNRVLLTVVGLLTLLAGAAVLATGSGWGTRLGVRGLAAPDGTLIPAGRGLQPWVIYAVVVAAVLIAVLALRWMAAQTRRRPRSRTWRLAADDTRGNTFLGADVAAHAVAEDVEDYSGVYQARAVLLGERREPALHLTVQVYPDTSLDELRAHIDGHALPRLRAALELDVLPADVLIRLHDQPRSTAARLH